MNDLLNKLIGLFPFGWRYEKRHNLQARMWFYARIHKRTGEVQYRDKFWSGFHRKDELAYFEQEMIDGCTEIESGWRHA